MQIIAWEHLPEKIQKETVRPYYDALRQRRGSLFLKRSGDVLVSIILLILLSPLFLLLSVLVKLGDRGPVFFSQLRVTQYGKLFKIFKFRTMKQNSETLGQLTVGEDQRVTRVGAFLRATRLDELPQLWNILSGDMSLVGTRPEVPRYVDAYSSEMLATLLLPAGVTSLASLKFQDEAELLAKSEDTDKTYIEEILPKKMRYNLDYLKDYRLGRDLSILFQTFFVPILGTKRSLKN